MKDETTRHRMSADVEIKLRALYFDRIERKEVAWTFIFINNNIVSCTFLIQYNVVSCTFLIQCNVVSCTFLIQYNVVSSNFLIQYNVVSSTFLIQYNVVYRLQG